MATISRGIQALPALSSRSARPLPSLAVTLALAAPAWGGEGLLCHTVKQFLPNRSHLGCSPFSSASRKTLSILRAGQTFHSGTARVPGDGILSIYSSALSLPEPLCPGSTPAISGTCTPFLTTSALSLSCTTPMLDLFFLRVAF